MNTKIAKIASILAIVVAAMLPRADAQAAVTLSIQSISPSTTISQGTTVSFVVVANGFNNKTFRVTDSFTSNSSATIDSNGNFRWTPSSNDIGTHTFTVTVTDNVGNVATAQQQIVVTSFSSGNALTIQSIFPGTSVSVGQQVLFTAAASGFTNPSFSLNDSFIGSSLRSSNINSSGSFNWNPQSQDTGTHVITVFATDSFGRSASAQTTINVGVNNGSGNVSASIQGPFPSTSVSSGTQVTFSMSTFGFINPTFSVSDSFSGTSISNFNINSSTGFFTWTPTLNDTGTHFVTVNVSDSFGRFRTAQATITVFNSGVNNGCNNFAFNNNCNSQSTIDLLLAQLNTLRAQLASLIGSGNSFVGGPTVFVTSNPSATVPVLGSGTDFGNGFNGFNNFNTFTFLSIGSSGSQVVALQQRLANLGIFFGPITGFYGTQTQSAVFQFQAQRGLSQTGSVDSQTSQALGLF